MKTTAMTAVMMILGLAAGAASLAAAEAGPERVGVYDSRALAYAHFWSAEASRSRATAIAAARAAKEAGDSAAFARRSRELAAHQQQMHEQVFGTAPAVEALAALAAREAALRRELGVARLVSKWDEPALRAVPEASRVDVTDRLVREFITPTEQQQKVLETLKAKKPVSRWRLKALNLLGAA